MKQRAFTCPLQAHENAAGGDETSEADIRQVIAIVAALLAENDEATCLAFVNGIPDKTRPSCSCLTAFDTLHGTARTIVLLKGGHSLALLFVDFKKGSHTALELATLASKISTLFQLTFS